jgi:hypothetical protein
MNGKIREFIFSFVLYCTGFFILHNWSLTPREIAEMIFIGVLLGLFHALMMNPMRRLIEHVVRRYNKA